MLRVSILGPVSTTSRSEECEQILNVRRMLDVASEIYLLGVIPSVPGLCVFWHMVHPMEREAWIDISREEILRSDACYRMAGPSKGADAEIEFAESVGIPVFYSLETLEAWSRISAPNDRPAPIPRIDASRGDPDEAREAILDFDRLRGVE